jgi:hypothetical protein
MQYLYFIYNPNPRVRFCHNGLRQGVTQVISPHTFYVMELCVWNHLYSISTVSSGMYLGLHFCPSLSTPLLSHNKLLKACVSNQTSPLYKM